MSDDDKKVFSIEGHLAPNDLRVALGQIKRAEGEWLEIQRVWAKIQRAKYQACIDEGFSAAEALELCKKITV